MASAVAASTAASATATAAAAASAWKWVVRRALPLAVLGLLVMLVVALAHAGFPAGPAGTEGTAERGGGGGGGGEAAVVVSMENAVEARVQRGQEDGGEGGGDARQDHDRVLDAPVVCPVVEACPPAEACPSAQAKAPTGKDHRRATNTGVPPKAPCPQAPMPTAAPFPWLVGDAPAGACPRPAPHATLPSVARRGFAAFAAQRSSWGMCYIRALNLIAVNSAYGLVCFTLESDIPHPVREAMQAVNVEFVTLVPFQPRPPQSVRSFTRLPKNWRISFDRLTMLGYEGPYDLLAYLDADLIQVDNADELLDASGFDIMLTPETDPCEHAFPQGVNGGVVVFRPRLRFLQSLQEFSADMITKQDWAVFKTSDQSLVAWFLRRYYPGARAYADLPTAHLTERGSRLGKERALFASPSYNMPVSTCACNVTANTEFDRAVWPFVKLWHFTTLKPYRWLPTDAVPVWEHCFCPLLHQYRSWMDLAKQCTGQLLDAQMETPPTSRH